MLKPCEITDNKCTRLQAYHINVIWWIFIIATPSLNVHGVMLRVTHPTYTVTLIIIYTYVTQCVRHTTCSSQSHTVSTAIQRTLLRILLLFVVSTHNHQYTSVCCDRITWLRPWRWAVLIGPTHKLHVNLLKTVPLDWTQPLVSDCQGNNQGVDSAWSSGPGVTCPNIV